MSSDLCTRVSFTLKTKSYWVCVFNYVLILYFQEMHPGYSIYCRGSVNIFTLLLNIHHHGNQKPPPPIPFHSAAHCLSRVTLT